MTALVGVTEDKVNHCQSIIVPLPIIWGSSNSLHKKRPCPYRKKCKPVLIILWILFIARTYIKPSKCVTIKYDHPHLIFSLFPHTIAVHIGTREAAIYCIRPCVFKLSALSGSSSKVSGKGLSHPYTPGWCSVFKSWN